MVAKVSVDQIEECIRQLSKDDLAKLTRWLAEYLGSQQNSPHKWEESDEQRAELERRLAEFLNNPAILTPFEPNYFEDLRRQLADERPKKASAR